MYSRTYFKTPDTLVKNGKPVFGSFEEPPKSLDVRGVWFPFGVLPFPPFITNLRIRSTLFFEFSTDTFIGSLELLDAKMVGYLKFVIWDRATGKKYAYNNFMGLRRRLIPKNLRAAVCATFSKNRYVRIAWDRSINRFSCIFSMKGDNVRPSISGTFISSFDGSLFSQLTSVSPAPSFRRCSALYQMSNEFKGSFSSCQRDKREELYEQKGLFLFGIKRAYYNLRHNEDTLTAQGIVKGKHVVFRISTANNDAFVPDMYNENVLIVDGVKTLLPPVKITRPSGFQGKWIIQDTESMIDLSFTPRSDDLRLFSIFILHARYHTIQGSFSGVLLTKNAEEINLKDFTGIAGKQRIRL